jgi:CRP-like cAMP-binding protein
MLLIDKAPQQNYFFQNSSILNEHYDRKRLHIYEKGEIIPIMPSGLWQVDRGIIQLSKIYINGEEVVLGWASSDVFFGILFEGLPIYQAQALSDVYLRWFSQEEISNSSHLTHILLTQMSRRLIQSEELLAIAGLRRVEDRLWQLLLLLKAEMGQEIPQGVRIIPRMTHHNLANVINTTRVTVTRILGEFQTRGLISWDSDRHIIINDYNVPINNPRKAPRAINCQVGVL